MFADFGMMELQRVLASQHNAVITPAADDVIAMKDKTLDAGGHRTLGSISISAIVATFIPTFLTAVLFLAIFVAIRNKYRKIYTPRTYIGVVPEKDRTPLPGRGRYDWFHSFRTLDDKFVLRSNSLDAYCFLRFLRTIILLCFVGSCITWPILFPVNATGGGGASQLDRISFSNVTGTKRLYAHAVVAWLFLGFVMVLVARERIFLIGLRQAYLLSKSNAARLSSRTVLFLSAPKEVVHEENLRRIFGNEARRHWIITNLDDIESVVSDRNDSAMMLEAAEVEWSKNANKKRLQGSKIDHSNGQGLEDGRDISLIYQESRPSHRLTPLVGGKVDTIQWSRKQVAEKSREVQKARELASKSKPKHPYAVFVEFSTQAAAQRACQQLSYHEPMHLEPRYIGVLPKEVIWKNLCLSPTNRISRGYVTTAFIVATILLWSIPIGIVGTISNINYLTGRFHFLRFINNLPNAVLGLLTGLLPPYLVSELVSYVPKIFRYIAKVSGEPTNSQAELKTQTWYYAFQVIQVFLVTTFTSGAAAVARKIAQDPTSLPLRLAQNLPKASNFYLTYFILQGTASAAKNVLNYWDLLEYLGYDMLFDKTPRAKYSRYTHMKGIRWGTVYPKFANMAIIAIAYACIAPLVLGFATIGIFLYYLSYRYNLLFVIQTKVDTKGESYTRALQHLLTGVYLSELCLIGLFGLREASGPSALMVILLIITVVYHITVNEHLGPLERYLPTDLQAEDEERPLLEAEEGPATQDIENQPESQIEHIGRGRVPDRVLEPVAEFLEPHIFASHQALKSWFEDPQEEPPEYSEEELRTAYLNPALTSKTPKLWLVRDEMGISKHEIQENEKEDISSTDEGATLDEKNRIVWPVDDLTKVPIFKMPVKY